MGLIMDILIDFVGVEAAERIYERWGWAGCGCALACVLIPAALLVWLFVEWT